MEVAVVVAFAAVAAGVVVGLHLARRAALRRRLAFQAAVSSRGWQLVERDDSYAYRWGGSPFRTGHGRARHVVSGHHRGRDFVAFEYSYATTSHGRNPTTTITHRFAVWAVGLPAPVPEMSVGHEGALAGKVAEALGAPRIHLADDEFDRAFKVRCDDDLFAAKVLQPPLVQFLKSTGPWSWRFDGDTMLAYEKGRLAADRIAPKLDTMAGVLDRVPADAWRHYGYNAR